MSTKKEHTVKRILAEKIDELRAHQEQRLNEIEQFVKGELTKINDRNKAINGYVVSEAAAHGNGLYNMSLTIDAMKKLFNEANLIADIETKLAEMRKTLHEEKEKAAVDKMQADMQQPPAPEAAPQEAPAAVEEKAPEQQSVEG